MRACGKEADHAAATKRLMLPLQTGGNPIRRFIISPCGHVLRGVIRQKGEDGVEGFKTG